MVDHLTGRLLEDAVNTSCKLALVLLYAEHDHLAYAPQELAQRLGRDPWSIETAIKELTAAGILAQNNGRVVYRPASHWQEALKVLHAAYDDPFYRDEVASRVREAERYAPYRDEFLKLRVSVA